MNRGDLAFTIWPCPVREDVNEGEVWTPAGLVEIETVLLETCEV